jgi:hypothetical protein
MPRKVHRVGSMIACLLEGRALLLDPKDFSVLVDKLLNVHDPLDATAFKLAVLQDTAIGQARKKLKKWESVFLRGLKWEISQNRFDPCYAFEDNDARKHVDDYLEAFRSSFRYINVATAGTHDGRDVLFNVSLRARQSPIDWLLRRYGRTVDEWNFLRSEVSALTGSSLNFVATIGGLTYTFAPEGVRRGSKRNDA